MVYTVKVHQAVPISSHWCSIPRRIYLRTLWPNTLQCDVVKEHKSINLKTVCPRGAYFSERYIFGRNLCSVVNFVLVISHQLKDTAAVNNKGHIGNRLPSNTSIASKSGTFWVFRVQHLSRRHCSNNYFLEKLSERKEWQELFETKMHLTSLQFAWPKCTNVSRTQGWKQFSREKKPWNRVCYYAM